MATHFLVNKLSSFQQLMDLKSKYENVVGHLTKNGFECNVSVKPTALSSEYKLKIVYVLGSNPKVYVLEPRPLLLAKDCCSLPHVYNSKRQQLCLFYPKAKEWNAGMSIATSVVHWAIEWLFYYEIWLITGTWEGGGIHPRVKKDT